MAVVLASSRSMPDFDAAALALDHVPEAVLAAKEDVCPTGVPFVALSRFVRAKAALMTMGGAEGPPQTPLVPTPRRRALPVGGEA